MKKGWRLIINMSQRRMSSELGSFEKFYLADVNFGRLFPFISPRNPNSVCTVNLLEHIFTENLQSKYIFPV